MEHKGFADLCERAPSPSSSVWSISRRYVSASLRLGFSGGRLSLRRHAWSAPAGVHGAGAGAASRPRDARHASARGPPRAAAAASAKRCAMFRPTQQQQHGSNRAKLCDTSRKRYTAGCVKKVESSGAGTPQNGVTREECEAPHRHDAPELYLGGIDVRAERLHSLKKCSSSTRSSVQHGPQQMYTPEHEEALLCHRCCGTCATLPVCVVRATTLSMDAATPIKALRTLRAPTRRLQTSTVKQRNPLITRNSNTWNVSFRPERCSLTPARLVVLQVYAGPEAAVEQHFEGGHLLFNRRQLVAQLPRALLRLRRRGREPRLGRVV